MAKEKKNEKKNVKISKEKKETVPRLKTETMHTIWAIVFFVLALFLFMASFDGAGSAGRFFYRILHYLLGVGYMLLPVLFLLVGASFIKSERPDVGALRTISAIVFLISGLGMISIAGGVESGGLLGKVFSSPLVSLFDVYASIMFLGAFLIISILVMFDTKPDLIALWRKILNLFGRKNNNEDEYEDEAEDEEDYEEEVEDEDDEEKPMPAKPVLARKINEDEEEDMPIKKRKVHSTSTYVPPPITLLEEDKGKPNTGDTKENGAIIKRTLANFGIEVEMDEITVGPTVTRYALKPAEGVKLSRIVALQNDLALALAAHPIRIEAPIPGKSLVGIEIPNKSKSTVGLGSLLSDNKFQDSDKPLTVALGRSISGKAIFGNLAKMPHALVAGTTGSGKSVTIHTIITSLLYRNGPDELKFIFVDPKRVELTLYKNIPHLLTPVITDAKKCILALKWAAKEMERRYDILEGESVRDIQSYHTNVVAKSNKNTKNEDGSSEESGPDPMPYIVIIIDELADIMTSYPRELEAGIVRLAQMSRAVGIHLILSTQRPEVNVITGLIKANIPARVALKVSSQIDSRTILDAGGAEKLLGAGDMLYSSGEASPERLQSAFISEGEVKAVVKYLYDAFKDEIQDEINLTGGSISADKSIFESSISDDEMPEDELYEEARQMVVSDGKASTSYLQRKLRLGYSRAARLIDMLEERGVIGPKDGSRERTVLERINRDESGNNQVE